MKIIKTFEAYNDKQQGFPFCTTENYINKNTPFKFICYAERNYELKENEYFAMLVTDYANTGYGKNPNIECKNEKGEGIVGLEKPTANKGYYITKNFNTINRSYRGTTIVVQVDDSILNKQTILD